MMGLPYTTVRNLLILNSLANFDKIYPIKLFFSLEYEVIKDQPGDSYYVRAMFDRVPETNDSSQLTFQKDDILYIDNTMYNGVPGHWSAWLVDNEGQRTRWGIIPSKYKVSELCTLTL